MSREPADAALVALAADGDVHAWSRLYDRYAEAVYSFAAHTVGRDHAEDIVQEVFMGLWRSASGFDPDRGAFRAWFFGLVRHRIRDELRRRRREERLLVAADVDELLAEAPIPGIDVVEQAAGRERGHTMLRALQTLPPDQRRVLVLAYFGGELSQSEIAGFLGWPLGTVKKRTRLGLQKLRALMEEESVGHSSGQVHRREL